MISCAGCWRIPASLLGILCFFQKAIDDACLTQEEVDQYGGDKDVIGWHISQLKIYDKPKELSSFIVASKSGCCNEGKCRGCPHFEKGNGFNLEDDCVADFNTDEYKPLRRPPQSWCYVEELTDNEI